MLDELPAHEPSSHDSDPPENTLEHLLRLATQQPGRRPEFYRALLDANVWVLLEGGAAAGRTTLPAGSDIALVNWPLIDGTFVIPFFTSVLRIREATPERYDTAQMTGRELFEATRGQSLHLNPLCQYGRAFAPREIEVLLKTGTITNMSTEVTQESRQVVIEPVEEPPSETLEALNDLYRRTRAVLTAHLVRFCNPAEPGASTLVIAIEAELEDDSVIHDTATVVRETFRRNEMVDLLFVRSTDYGIGQHIAEHMRPFYQRAES
jgi:hypothetical protein